MSSYSPAELKRRAVLALAAREVNDERWLGLLMRLMLATGWSSLAIIDSIEQLAE